jgi:hypothetical protein
MKYATIMEDDQVFSLPVVGINILSWMPKISGYRVLLDSTRLRCNAWSDHSIDEVSSFLEIIYCGSIRI